jgi:hypothetical protein
MTHKECRRCGAGFAPPEGKDYRYLCERCFYESLPPRCAAATRTGKQCQEHVFKGELFCLSHLRRGYKLFDLAAKTSGLQFAEVTLTTPNMSSMSIDSDISSLQTRRKCPPKKNQ